MLSRPALLRLIARSKPLRRSYTTSGPVAERNVIDELESRGYISALTSPQLRQHVKSPTCLYAGVDPSASSLHVGNLLPLMGLLHFRTAGHKAIAIIGGATGSIGDPSGRSTERHALSPAELETNIQGITSQVDRFFQLGQEYVERRGGYAAFARGIDRDRKGKSKDIEGRVEVLNNLEWTRDVGLLDFLRTVGKMARVNVMLARDSVKNRLTSEQGISFTEFTYQLLQASDFLHLYRNYGCTIQLGGSDQWGNIVAGIDLIKRIAAAEHLDGEGSGMTAEEKVEESGMGVEGKREPAFGLTIPLLTTSSGEKFGKSAGNAVWLDHERTSVSDFYQFFLRSSDLDVDNYLRIFSWMPVSRIEELMVEHQRGRQHRLAQKVLADEVTELVHGKEAVHKAHTIARMLFHSDARSLKADDVLQAFEGDHRFVRVRWADVKGVPITKLITTYGMCKARADATRAVRSGALFINDRKISDPRDELHRQEMIEHRVAILRLGTKNHLIIHVDDPK